MSAAIEAMIWNVLLSKYPRFEGRLVLQELPGVLQNVKGLNEDIKAIVHDSFTPQPIKGIHICNPDDRS